MLTNNLSRPIKTSARSNLEENRHRAPATQQNIIV